MWFRAIPNERRASNARCVCVTIDYANLRHVLGRLGLPPAQHRLFEVARERGIQILEAILWKDMAYSLEVMTRSRAHELSKAFFNDQTGLNARFYTNGDWTVYQAAHDSRDNFAFAFNPITEATFDGGIVAVNEKQASCVWIEDED